MNIGEFNAEEWVVQLDIALDRLAKAQEPYLNEYRGQNRRTHVLHNRAENQSSNLLADDLRGLYAASCFLRETDFKQLANILDPVRYVLLSHPAIEEVAGRTIGRDEFWVQILDSGGQTSLTDLIAGLMARASELSGDRFRAAATELNYVLTPTGDSDANDLPTEINDGCDVVLFWGLELNEPVQIGNGMVVVPFKNIRAFLDENQVDELAPSGSRFRGFKSIGAVIRTFRWNPQLRRTGESRQTVPLSSHNFFRAAITFIDILSVAHSIPIVPLAAFAKCINRSAALLLVRTSNLRSYSIVRSSGGFDGLEECPSLIPEALFKTKVALTARKGAHFKRFAVVLARLTEALSPQSRFATTDRFIPLAVALEIMYDIPKNNSSRKLRNRVSEFLGTDLESRETLEEHVRRFYDERSASVHNRLETTTAQEKQEAFELGFEIAKRTFFKILKKGRPDDWDRIEIENG